jgi:hypothetical protein
MAPGFRYHVATIAAIFLALGVGIIVGSSFVQSAIVDRMTHRLEEMREQFATEVVVARDKNKRYADFVSALKPILVDGKLTGKRVALVQTGDHPETVRKVREALEQAGATVTSETVIDRGFPTRAKTNLSELLPKLRASHPNLPDDASALIRVLSLAVARGVPEEDLQALEGARLIRRQGDYSQSTDFVVLVGGATLENESRAESLDSPLVEQIKSLGVKVVVTEPEQTPISYIPVLRGSGVTTVDNADTDIGAIALVLALRSQPGSYGVKAFSHDGILPPTPLADDLRHNSGL